MSSEISIVLHSLLPNFFHIFFTIKCLYSFKTIYRSTIAISAVVFIVISFFYIIYKNVIYLILTIMRGWVCEPTIVGWERGEAAGRARSG